ncbi:MAG: hypothetical protein ACLUHE_05440 [Christensenellales bacterium]
MTTVRVGTLVLDDLYRRRIPGARDSINLGECLNRPAALARVYRISAPAWAITPPVRAAPIYHSPRASLAGDTRARSPRDREKRQAMTRALVQAVLPRRAGGST